MDEAQLVGAREPPRDVRADPPRLGLGDRAARDPGRQRLTLEELEDGVRDGAVRIRVEERADVGVREACRDLRLAREAPERFGVVAVARGDDLERNVALEPRVARPIHLAHASGPERSKDLVRPEARPGPERHGSGTVTPVFRGISAT